MTGAVMNQMERLLAMMAISTAMVGCAGSAVTGQRVSEAGLEGHWKGEARVIVEWAKARTIAVDVQIAPDGQVSGRVGDAKLTNAKIREGRDSVQQMLHMGAAYVIAGDLEGDLIEQEQIKRSGIKIIIDQVGQTLNGGIHTSGSEIGGKRSMRFSASNMVLERVVESPGGSK